MQPIVTSKRKKAPLGQSIGGVLFGFEQQVLRNQPPPHELVHHARPDDPVPAGDGDMVIISIPDPAGAREADPTVGLTELARSADLER